MLNTQSLIDLVQSTPEQVEFKSVIEVIDRDYDFTPSAFTNGEQQNQANENNGSCKILAFAKLNQLTPEQSLQLFGDYYRVDVLQHPEARDHQNIRQFMIHGWQGVSFTTSPLTLKA